MQRKDIISLIQFILKLVLLTLVVSAFAWVWYQFFAEAPYVQYYRRGNWIVIFMYAVIYYGMCKIYSSFRVGYFSLPELLFNQIIALILANIIIYVFTCLVTLSLANALIYIAMTIVQFFAAFIWAYIANKAYCWQTPKMDTLVIYQDDKVVELLKKMGSYPQNFLFDTRMNISEGMDQILQSLQDYPAVLLCYLPSEPRDRILKACILEKKNVYLTPNVGDILISGAKRIHLLDTPILHCEAATTTLEYRVAKHIVDFLAALIMLVIASPFMLITAIIIKCYDRGPILYKQERLTQYGKRFYVYKFRSMIVNAEKDGVARLSSKNDNRITPIGKFIRATRIDELPQLINVLSGNMSLVGPRPERPVIAEQYCKKWPEFALRLQVKAGLTGYAQIFGKYNTTPMDKLRLDLMYIADHSLVQDFRILFLTIKTVFMKDSTEGIENGATTAEK
ncbi:sugar transferase [Eubacterium aggregans]|uniref:sugar transferase n=1 Tax=Eubacterium aggregans TaxID=81409 RepID=UPI003F3AFDEF